MMANINVDSYAGGAPGGSADVKPPGNPKEKTPMCLINELSRYNKLKHTYTLVDEQGPAHKKTFFVKLQLGNEEYSASEGSIKRAQHLAAQQALAQSKYQPPPAKEPRENLGAYDVESDKVIRSKPAPTPNPPGFKKQMKAEAAAKRAAEASITPPKPKYPKPPAPPQQYGAPKPQIGGPKQQQFSGSKPQYGANKPSGQKPGGQGFQKPGGQIKSFSQSFAQKSVDRAKNYMQNRNGGGSGSFGFGGSRFGGGGYDSGPSLKRPRMEMGFASGMGNNSEAMDLKRQRIEQEWEKISIQRKMMEIETRRLEMENEKYQYEIRLLEFQLLEYEKSSLNSSVATGASARKLSARMEPIQRLEPLVPSPMDQGMNRFDQQNYQGSYGSYSNY